MKNFIFISLLLFLISCQKNGIIEEVDATGNVCFNTYKNGKLDGLSTCYYYNSKQKKSESTYIEGTRKDHKAWYEDGIKSEEINYLWRRERDDLTIMSHYTWHRTGEDNTVKIYENNGNISLFSSYFKNGELSMYRKYKNGKLDGEEFWCGWDYDANKRYISTRLYWKEGKKDSLQWQYDKYGRAEEVEKYFEGNIWVRIRYKYANKYDKKGTLVSKECWDIYGNKKECN